MLKYEPEVITTLKSQLLGALRLLEELKTEEFYAFKGNLHLISSAKYNLIVAIEAAIDICNHLISKNGYRVPDGYSDVFRVLAEQKILRSELVDERLVAMARFRNRLVHQYWAIDSDLLYSILNNNLSDFKAFLAEIQEQL